MPTALITGATAGIGAEFARQLAAAGNDLVLVARDEARLESTSVALTERFGVAVEVVAADLCTDGGCDAVVRRVADAQRPVDVVVNNAGFGMYKKFGDAELADEERQLDLNVRAVLRVDARRGTRHGSSRLRAHHQHLVGRRLRSAWRQRHLFCEQGLGDDVQ